MKASFVASHTQKDELKEYYSRVHNLLELKGYEVFSGSLFDDSGDPVTNEDTRKKWYKWSTNNIKKADIVVVEISYPSTANVGHELTFALELGKPVVALYNKGRNPIYLQGIVEEKFVVVSYDEHNLEDVLSDAIEYASEQQDTRFNFFISPRHQNYLDHISKTKKVPRAVFLRNLIEEEMEADEEYNQAN